MTILLSANLRSRNFVSSNFSKFFSTFCEKSIDTVVLYMTEPQNAVPDHISQGRYFENFRKTDRLVRKIDRHMRFI